MNMEMAVDRQGKPHGALARGWLRTCASTAAVSFLLLTLGALHGAAPVAGPALVEAPPTPKPVPVLQVLPLPLDQVSFQYQGFEVARYYYATNLARPFMYPIMGPAGQSLTRMGHPHDPETHSHHNSFWVSHALVNGISFWEDRGQGKIIHQRMEKLEDGDQEAQVTVQNAWQVAGQTLLLERRRMTLRLMDGKDWLWLLDIRLTANGEPVTLGQTAFGLVGVRMAKTIGVHDGGGRILNSAGQLNEAGVFRQPARWVDYSGPITSTAMEGLTLLDHPANVSHPTPFHVRNDGWMGASLTLGAERVIEPGKPLVLRYGLYAHADMPRREAIQKVEEIFQALPRPDLTK